MTRTDEAGILRGYVYARAIQVQGIEIGKGRNIMASKLEGTWNKLHNTTEQHTRDDYNHYDYTVYRSGTRRLSMTEYHTRFIPEPVMKVFDDSFRLPGRRKEELGGSH